MTTLFLLLRIGDLVIADWSHNGTMRFWRDHSPGVPIFYEQAYVANTLRQGAIHEERHLGAWQDRASAFIRRHTGIHMSPQDYLPRQTKR